MELPQADYSFSLRDVVLPVWRRLWMVVGVVLIVFGATMGFTLTQTPIYQSDIKLLVGPEKSGTPENLGSEVPGLQALTQTMTSAVDTDRVARGVVRELNTSMTPSRLLSNLSAEQDGATQLIDVSYQDSDPGRAQRVANTVGKVFSREVSKVNAGANGAVVTVWDSAALPKAPVSPNIPLIGLVGLVVGLMLGVALAFLLEHLDDRWRSPEDVERVAGVPTFGVIPPFKVPKNKVKAG
ncbi:MAG: hypothetical protein H0U55_16615 [Rubrobacteraceae bacterium]|nr:hypothetical protein [Rubrobacteraceae bacterium]